MFPCSEGNVHLLEPVEPGQQAPARHAAEDVDPRAPQQRRRALGPEDVAEAVQGAAVLRPARGSHHHACPDQTCKLCSTIKLCFMIKA